MTIITMLVNIEKKWCSYSIVWYNLPPPQHVLTYPKHLERQTWIRLRFLYPMVYAEVRKTVREIMLNAVFEKKIDFLCERFGGGLE